MLPKCTTQPSLTIDKTDAILMARLMPQQATFPNPTDPDRVLAPRRNPQIRQESSRKLLSSILSPYQHKDGYPYGVVKPMLFPAGFQTFRNIDQDDATKVNDVVMDLKSINKSKFDAIIMFANLYDVPAEVVHNSLGMTFHLFFQNHVRKNIEDTTRLPYYVRPPMTQLTPDDWIHYSKHPALYDVTQEVGPRQVYSPDPKDCYIPIPKRTTTPMCLLPTTTPLMTNPSQQTRPKHPLPGPTQITHQLKLKKFLKLYLYGDSQT